jgi:hypothetical protein
MKASIIANIDALLFKVLDFNSNNERIHFKNGYLKISTGTIQKNKSSKQ